MVATKDTEKKKNTINALRSVLLTFKSLFSYETLLGGWDAFPSLDKKGIKGWLRPPTNGSNPLLASPLIQGEEKCPQSSILGKGFAALWSLCSLWLVFDVHDCCSMILTEI
jgi:hypothetical protein